MRRRRRRRSSSCWLLQEKKENDAIPPFLPPWNEKEKISARAIEKAKEKKNERRDPMYARNVYCSAVQWGWMDGGREGGGGTIL